MSRNKKKRKKLRVPFRKNRQRRTRQQNLTQDVLEDGAEAADLPAEERVGKGELTRYRTIIGVEDDEEGELRREVDESQCLVGRVLSAGGLMCRVRDEDGNEYECAIRRLVRTLARDERNAVVTGDRVLFRPVEDGRGAIERVESRERVLSRQSHGREHIMAANVDQALIVVSAAEPPLKPGLIDRFLISAEKGGVRPVICINKADLVDTVELQRILGLYGRLGYEVVLTSAFEATGLERLRSLLKDRQTVLSGQSGVGKSSLLNALQPGLELRTAEVNRKFRKGRHTTRLTLLLPLDFGGWVVDTPGIRQLELWDVQPAEVEGYFIEFRPFVPLCRFPDCTHTHEDACGVKRAVRFDLISSLRYENYRRIIEDEPS